MITVREALTEGASFLQDRMKNLRTPFLDAMVLLAHTLKITKEELLASYPDRMTSLEFAKFRTILEKRATNYPVSYITQKKEFFGIVFYVDENVLVPRPDSECLVEEAIDILKRIPGLNKVLDLCTGSGALAIALKHSLPELWITCSDLSKEALDVARKNSLAILGEELECINSDLFHNITGCFDMIVTNPPYLTTEETMGISGSGWPEPGMALMGGKDGLDFIREIIKKAPDYLQKSGYLLIESGMEQTETISNLMGSANFNNIRVIKDLAGRPRVTIGQRA